MPILVNHFRDATQMPYLAFSLLAMSGAAVAFGAVALVGAALVHGAVRR